MFKYLSSFYISLLIGLSCAPLFAQPSVDPQIKWYESFFTEKAQKSAEDILKQKTSRLKQAIKKNDKVAEAKALKEIGLVHLTQHTYDQAINFFIKALVIEDSLQLVKEQVFTYIGIAKVFEEIGDFDKSATSLEEAILLNEQADNIKVFAFILNKLGKVNAARGHLTKAIVNFNEVLRHKKAISQNKVEAEALFHLARIYTKQGKYEDALQTHKNALALWRSVQDKFNEAQSLNDIGELYRLMKNDERVLLNHAAALEIRAEISDARGAAESFNNIGIFHFDHNQYDSAIVYLEYGLTAATEARAHDETSRSHDYLSGCFKALGNFQKALAHKEEYVGINELIQREKNDQKITEAQNRYVIEKHKSQIDKLESIRVQSERELQAEKEKVQAQKKIQNYLFLAVGLSLTVGGLIVHMYLTKKRSNKILQAAHTKLNQQNVELQELNATKDKFFSIISHDLKGPLNSLTSFSGLLINHTDSLSKEDIQMLAKDLDKSLKNLFALLENLLEWSRSQTGNIEFKPEVFDLASLLEENRELLNAQAQNKRITIVNENRTNVSINAHKHSINTVVRNLISNAIKFTPEEGTITLRIQQRKNEVIVSVADTGVGMSPEIIKKLFRLDTKHSTKGTADEKGTGLGLILCKEFIEKNRGRIWVKSEVGKGSEFYFMLPHASVQVGKEDIVFAN